MPALIVVHHLKEPKMAKIVLFLFFVVFNNQPSKAHFVEEGAFKIFRGKIAGADINLRIDSESTYELKAVEFWCSLCDIDKLSKDIYQKGKWELINDSLKLSPNDTSARWYFLKIDESRLKPLFSVNRDVYNIEDDSLRNRLLNNIATMDIFDFELIYETYNNGIVKEAKYQFGDSKNEYHVIFDKSGEIKKIVKYRKGRKTNKLIK